MTLHEIDKIERIKSGMGEINKLKNIEFCAGFLSYR
jgi:hypothetical protein